MLILMFLVFFVTACDGTQTEGNRDGENKYYTQTSEESKDKESSSIKDNENKDMSVNKSSTSQAEHPMVIKSEGRLRLDLGMKTSPFKDNLVESIHYDNIFENDSVDYNNEKYADKTKDGKIDWTVIEKREFEETPKVMEFMERVTLDGKKVFLPMKFSDLGEEYSVFDKVDFSVVTEEMHPFQIVDITTNNKLSSASSGIFLDTKFFDILNNNNTLILNVGVSLKTNEINYLDTQTYNIISNKQLAIDGIGVGNTINEVYERFGVPTKIRNKDKYAPSIQYRYGEYYFSFGFAPTLYNPTQKKEDKVIKNTVTSVSVCMD